MARPLRGARPVAGSCAALVLQSAGLFAESGDISNGRLRHVTRMEKEMLNWRDYRSNVKKRVGDLSKLAPEAIKGYMALATSGEKATHLDGKTRELISLAVAVTTKCDGCIASHVEAAVKFGASKEELAEALGVAIAMNAGSALVYSARTMDCFDEMSREPS
jgi:AhpD family alkylhydroperoxidase